MAGCIVSNDIVRRLTSDQHVIDTAALPVLTTPLRYKDNESLHSRYKINFYKFIYINTLSIYDLYS
jgi:hypothetical protein